MHVLQLVHRLVAANKVDLSHEAKEDDSQLQGPPETIFSRTISIVGKGISNAHPGARGKAFNPLPSTPFSQAKASFSFYKSMPLTCLPGLVWCGCMQEHVMRGIAREVLHVILSHEGAVVADKRMK